MIYKQIVTFVVFAGVLLVIALDLLDMTLAALLGVSTLIAVGVFTLQDILNVVRTFGGPLALLFGGMVVARTLVPTGLFDYIGNIFLRATQGSGKRFLVGLVVLVAPLCAFLPNATTVVLLAPIIIRVASALKVDLVAPLVLTAIVSNSAGLLILVGDPATFLVGSSIGMTFHPLPQTGESRRSIILVGDVAVSALAYGQRLAGSVCCDGEFEARAAQASAFRRGFTWWFSP